MDNLVWFRIKAKDLSIDKQNGGRWITFWLWGDSETHIRDILDSKGHHDPIEYIIQDKPSFVD